MKLFYTLSVILLTLPTVLFAQNNVYSPLVDLSNAGQGNQVQTFEQYINFLYGMSIAVAALLAVIKIVIAGAKYMLSDIINTKGQALADIQGAIVGLLLILSVVIILELINPQLVKKEIVFQQLDPATRGGLLPPAVQTVGGGQSTETVSVELFQGLNECTQKDQKTGPSGTRLMYRINSSACSDAAAEIAAFERNCQEKKGQFTKAKTIANQATCGIPIDGAKEGASLVESISNTQIINTAGTVGASYVKQVGTLITTDVNGACDNNVKDLPESQKKGQFTTCMTFLMGRTESVCSSQYGKYNRSNTSAVTCQIPRSVREIPSLSEAFETYKASDPSRKYDTIGALSENEQEIVCEKFAKGEYIDNTGAFGINDDVCAFY